MAPEDIPKVCLFPPNKTRARRGWRSDGLTAYLETISISETGKTFFRKRLAGTGGSSGLVATYFPAPQAGHLKFANIQ
jgi:hypothetical protein